MAALVVALFFFRYWQLTRDRLFLIFAAGFVTFAVSRLILALLDEGAEGRVFVYLLRLLAFALILAAIVDKNRGQAPHALGGSLNGSRSQADAAQRHSPARR